MKCTNHPDKDATFTARMPSSTKQPDGEYFENVPLCDPCTAGVSRISPSWKVTPTMPSDPTQLSTGLMVKLASLAIHAQEITQPRSAHAADFTALQSLAEDDDVVAWLATIDPVYLPVKR